MAVKRTTPEPDDAPAKGTHSSGNSSKLRGRAAWAREQRGLIENEIDLPEMVAVVVVPEGTPRHLDKRLRHQARALDHSWERLEPLIAEAKERQIHTALGFKSWPDYIADVARTEMPNVARSVEQRRQVVELLAGEGMSQRAIADTVGVSNATVSRDQAEVLHDVTPEPATVTGRDGKSYPAQPKPKPDVPAPQVEGSELDLPTLPKPGRVPVEDLLGALSEAESEISFVLVAADGRTFLPADREALTDVYLRLVALAVQLRTALGI